MLPRHVRKDVDDLTHWIFSLNHTHNSEIVFLGSGLAVVVIEVDDRSLSHRSLSPLRVASSDPNTVVVRAIKVNEIPLRDIDVNDVSTRCLSMRGSVRRAIKDVDQIDDIVGSFSRF